MTCQPGRRRVEAAAKPLPWLLTIAAAALSGLIVLPSPGAQLVAPIGTPEPVYWRQRQFLIPYQGSAQSPFGTSAAKVRLAVARDGSQSWTTLEEAAPNVRGFAYHAPADGEYAFAVTLSDATGSNGPSGPIQPQLRVVVDTQAPTLRLTASRDFSSQVIISYEANDAHLRPETLRIEAQADGVSWERLALGPPDVSYPDRLLGRLVWKPPLGANAARFRATIDDRAGNQTTATTEATPASQLQAADLRPKANIAPAPTVEWPATNSVTGTTSPATAPPLQNPYTVSAGTPVDNAHQRTPAQFTAGQEGGVVAPSLLTTDAAPPSLPSSSDWQAAPVEPGHAEPVRNESVQWINSLTVDVDYDLQTIGPWGVAKVELWATPDGGQTWNSLGVDSDNRSPFRATLPGPGVYGIRIVVEGVNGTPAPRPQAGDQPEMSLGVDIQPPRSEIVGAKVGQGEFADHLIITWSASDEQLGNRPVTLLVSEDALGPWSTIAADLPNTGVHRWRLMREPPQKLFLRLEVRDLAGNVATYQTPSPLVLILPQPTGRLRSVRPVTEDVGRFRTAERQP